MALFFVTAFSISTLAFYGEQIRCNRNQLENWNSDILLGSALFELTTYNASSL